MVALAEENMNSIRGQFVDQFSLGEGDFGKVYSTMWNKTVCAVKQYPLSLISASDLLLDLKAIQSADHENKLAILGYHLDDCTLYLFVPCYSKGSLEEHLRNNATKLQCDARLNIALGVTSAVAHLHTCYDAPMVHGRLKSTNVLLDVHLTPKVCDYSIAPHLKCSAERLGAKVKYNAKHPGAMATRAYLPPELLDSYPDIDYTTKSDVYSLGVILYELCTGLPAYDKTRSEPKLKDYVDECQSTLTMLTQISETRILWIGTVLDNLFTQGHLATRRRSKKRPAKDRPDMDVILTNLKEVYTKHVLMTSKTAGNAATFSHQVDHQMSADGQKRMMEYCLGYRVPHSNGGVYEVPEDYTMGVRSYAQPPSFTSSLGSVFESDSCLDLVARGKLMPKMNDDGSNSGSHSCDNGMRSPTSPGRSVGLPQQDWDIESTYMDVLPSDGSKPVVPLSEALKAEAAMGRPVYVGSQGSVSSSQSAGPTVPSSARPSYVGSQGSVSSSACVSPASPFTSRPASKQPDIANGSMSSTDSTRSPFMEQQHCRSMARSSQLPSFGSTSSANSSLPPVPSLSPAFPSLDAPLVPPRNVYPPTPEATYEDVDEEDEVPYDYTKVGEEIGIVNESVDVYEDIPEADTATAPIRDLRPNNFRNGIVSMNSQTSSCVRKPLASLRGNPSAWKSPMSSFGQMSADGQKRMMEYCLGYRVPHSNGGVYEVAEDYTMSVSSYAQPPSFTSSLDSVFESDSCLDLVAMGKLMEKMNNDGSNSGNQSCDNGLRSPTSPGRSVGPPQQDWDIESTYMDVLPSDGSKPVVPLSEALKAEAAMGRPMYVGSQGSVSSSLSAGPPVSSSARPSYVGSQGSVSSSACVSPASPFTGRPASKQPDIANSRSSSRSSKAPSFGSTSSEPPTRSPFMERQHCRSMARSSQLPSFGSTSSTNSSLPPVPSRSPAVDMYPTGGRPGYPSFGSTTSLDVAPPVPARSSGMDRHPGHRPGFLPFGSTTSLDAPLVPPRNDYPPTPEATYEDVDEEDEVPYDYTEVGEEIGIANEPVDIYEDISEADTATAPIRDLRPNNFRNGTVSMNSQTSCVRKPLASLRGNPSAWKSSMSSFSGSVLMESPEPVDYEGPSLPDMYSTDIPPPRSPQKPPQTSYSDKVAASQNAAAVDHFPDGREVEALYLDVMPANIADYEDITKDLESDDEEDLLS